VVGFLLEILDWRNQRHHVGKSATNGHVEERIFLTGVFVGDVFDEEKDVLVLRGIHAATQFIAAFPEGAVEFGFLDGHLLNGLLLYHVVAILWKFVGFPDNV
jgi:hypothetical protein